MPQQRPSLWPRPRQSWHHCWCRGLLPHVLREFLGAGLVNRPVKLNEAQCVTCIVYYYYLLYTITTYYYLTCYYLLLLFFLLCCCYIIIMHYHINRFYVVLLSLLLYCYYIIITYSSYYIIHYYVLWLFCYYTVITILLLRIITYSLLPIIAKSLLHIITSLLHYYYVIITSLFRISKTGNNELIITYYALSLFSLLHCYHTLLPLLPIITCYQLGNLQITTDMRHMLIRPTTDGVAASYGCVTHCCGAEGRCCCRWRLQTSCQRLRLHSLMAAAGSLPPQS